ncbi:MOSC domain-containing protein [Candidatus Saganbacteria bacterium CG08_land_8_20_14_0_20_45_16]|uniref:MOSC domain-containing protein n=1 Tax=Candidatus Saganbacteria bacterium CG08_land_8_20_14_0_20_45_16 TaxID=2014293 RepID=A0A2H0XWM0_UNCSA|nr:MAG: MOSC domain-containing protein [Candidatus Saganbacteria bacterium CG08_land_8_20_14_0_20_45_16]
MAKIKAVCISSVRGPKSRVEAINLIKDLGVENDYHAKGGLRQVSLLANESIQKQIAKGIRLEDGAFGENIITEGIELTKLAIGQKLQVGETELEITKIGKECVERCIIYHQTGDCIMPREGVFAKVLKGSKVKAGDVIQ